MRRAAVAIACLVLAGMAAAPASAGDPAPGRLLVTGTEYSLTLSRLKVDPGETIIQFANNGEDAHDMRIRRAGSDGEHGIGELESGGVASLDIRLRRDSTYKLWCSLTEPVNHRESGMAAKFQVRRHG